MIILRHTKIEITNLDDEEILIDSNRSFILRPINKLIKKMDFQLFIQDFVCGTFSGVGNCLSGYILDTLKVRMQMDHRLSMSATFKTIVKQEGFSKLFSGIKYPLLTVPIVNAVVFSSYQMFKKLTGKKQLSFWNGVENGAFAGLVNTVVVSPVELIKCHMQLDKQKIYKSSKDCAKAIVKQQGIKGLFQGSFSTAFRQIFAYGAQFAAYQFLKQKVVEQTHHRLNFIQGIIVGIFAGLSCWIFSYPQDIVKTMIQVSPPGAYQKILFDGGFFNCAAQIYRRSGFRGFWIGIEPCLWRAAVANGFGIAIYEQCQHRYSNPVQLHSY